MAVAPGNSEFIRLVAGLPPGLDSRQEPEDIDENFIPSGTGFDLSVDGIITKGTIPSGTAAIQKTITLSKSDGENEDSVPYLWHAERLWNITGRTASGTSNILVVGAQAYNDVFFHPDGREPIPFDQDVQPILKILPLEPDSLFVAKSTGSYVVRNLSDTRGFFQITDVIQEMLCPAANQVAELDSTVFCTNANGLMAYENGRTREVSLPIRGTDLSGLSVTADQGNKRLILGSTYVYDVTNDRFFNYSGSTFSFKSRVHRNEDWSPFAPSRLVFMVKNTASDDAEITYKVKYDDDDFSDEYTADVLFDYGTYTAVSERLDERRNCRRFQLEVTGMDAGVSIREIFLDVQNQNFDDRAP